MVLCRAYDAGHASPSGGRASTQAYRVLVSLAGGPGTIAGYCRSVLG